MNPQDSVQEQEKKIQSLEQELAELRQNLAAVEDYFLQVKALTDAHEVRAELDNEIIKAFTDEDAEFEGIWDFHQQILVADPDGSIPLDTMYETFARFCREHGRKPLDKDAFEYLLPQMENPRPEIFRGKWQGCRFR